MKKLLLVLCVLVVSFGAQANNSASEICSIMNSQLEGRYSLTNFFGEDDGDYLLFKKDNERFTVIVGTEGGTAFPLKAEFFVEEGRCIFKRSFFGEGESNVVEDVVVSEEEVISASFKYLGKIKKD